jgi:TRAP-type C4-dicarboxylate transport system permease small subunit
MSLKIFSKILGAMSSVLARLGALALFFMVILTSVDVGCRYVLNSPILGAFELTEFLVLIVIFSFIGYTQALKGHICVDLLVSRLPSRVQTWIEIFNHTICLLLMALIAWMGYQRALELMMIGDNSPNLMIPKYPFAIFLSIGCAVMCIEFAKDLWRLLSSLREREGS